MYQLDLNTVKLVSGGNDADAAAATAAAMAVAAAVYAAASGDWMGAGMMAGTFGSGGSLLQPEEFELEQ